MSSCKGLTVGTRFLQVLWGLLDQLPRIREKTLPDVTWRGAFERYCAGVPPYYANPLRAALRKWGLSPSLVPESMDRLSSSYAAAHLKRIRAHAKGEVDRELARLAVSIQSSVWVLMRVWSSGVDPIVSLGI